MERIVEAELLDQLPERDARALGSREDIRRLNRLMGNASTVALALRGALDGQGPRRLVELGAGDGRFLLDLARKLAPEWPGTTVTLLDRHCVVTDQTRAEFERLGWHAEVVVADVFDWLRQERESGAAAFDGMVFNLFLHHFPDRELAELLRGSAERASIFVAIEPRRSAWGHALSRLVGLLGCNDVTRHDAPVSVRAGFAGRELSSLWPANGKWLLREERVGVFGHLFVARRGETEMRSQSSDL